MATEKFAMPRVGAPAPTIDGLTSASAHFCTADHSGSWLVVWFFPRANTPG